MVQKFTVKCEFEAGLRYATTGKTLSNPAANGYLCLNEEYGSERRGMGFAFHQLGPRYSWTLTPLPHTAIRLWETFISVIRHFWDCFRIGFFSSLNNPKNLDPFHKMDLDFFGCFGRKKSI